MTADGGNLLELVRRNEAVRGDAPFLAVGDEVVSARAFAERVTACARGLRRAGFAPGDRLAVHLHRGVDEAVALLAAAAAGGIAVPVHGKLKDDQVAHVLADCEPWGVVTSATRTALLRDPEGTLGRWRLFATAGAPADGTGGVAAAGGLAAAPWPGAAAAPFAALCATGDDAPLAAPAAAAPAVLLYTSGSTGLAKGVVQTHGNLVLGAELVAGYLELSGADHLLGLLPLSFDYGLNQLLSALHAGARITAADFFGLGELATLLRRVRPTGLAGVPSLWHEVARGLRSGALSADDGRSLRYVTNSGGRLGADSVRALRAGWPHVRVFAMYGLTEAFRSAFLDPALLDAHPDSFGTALPGVELLLVDPETGAVLDGPATGELVHAGALVAQGYWRRPDATRERFRPDPRGGGGTVVYSGDLVRRDQDGLLSFVGRRDRMLKVQGHRVSPDEVAQAIADVPGVGAVAVYGGDAGAQGHAIVLCVAGDPRDALLRERIARLCRARLPAYMVPARVRVLAALPLTPNGKVDVVRLEREDPGPEPG
ncbi:MAG: AMP-binding protein [Planctomycetota bacterium]